MTNRSQYTDSESAFKPEVTPEQWKAVGDLARKLVQDMADRKAREAGE